jgi:hypothetical protein
MRCPRCGNISPLSTTAFCSQCGALISSGEIETSSALPTDHIAWETDQRRTAPLLTLFSTILEVIVHPDRFYKKAAAERYSAVPAWIFGLAAGSIGLLAAWFWSTLFMNYGKNAPFIFSCLVGEVPLPWILIATPFFLTFQFVLAASYVKIVMSMGRLKNATFAQIFRILCYAESPMVVQIIPLIGTFAGSLLWLYDILTGLHHLYAASRLRIFFLLLLPFFILIGLILIVIIAGVLGGILAGTGFLHGGRPFFDWLK